MELTGELWAPYMQEALELARQSRWRTFPNPMVGAVLVLNGQVVARGLHEGAGHPHAEVVCLEDARSKGIDPSSCTLVVTLEPCTHFGKTPPCTDAILSAGISRVVVGLRDPNPLARGGMELLQSHGVEVIGPVLEEECRDLASDFLVWTEKKRPYILLKMASTLDGRIATRSGQSQWISCEASRVEVWKLRKSIGAARGMVLVGGRTFRQDNPHLTARSAEKDLPQPLAAVLTSHLPAPTDDFHLLQERPAETIFFGSAAAAASTQANELRKRGVRVIPVPQYLNGATDLTGLFRGLFSEMSCPYVLCEGGGQLGISLLEEGLVDEFHLHLAPIILGDNDALPIFQGRMPLNLSDGIFMRCISTRIVGVDTHIVLRPKTAAGA